MTFVAHFTKMIHYTSWADRLCLDSFQKQKPPDKALLIFSHSIVCGVLWYDRVIGRPSVYPLWETIPIEKLRTISETSIADWLNLLEKKTDADLQEPISYKNTSGISYTTSLHDILTHAFNHATHHRGQVVVLMREAGIVPPGTDYILYIRELEKK